MSLRLLKNRNCASMLLTATAITLIAATANGAVRNWTPPGSSSWFTATNWAPSGIPSILDEANINNGGTALATGNPGPISVLGLNVGKNGGNGTLQGNGIDVQVQGSADIGVVDSVFATGAVTVVSSGSATLTDTTTIHAGVGGVGDFNAGQTSAAAGATAMGTGTITVERVGTLQTAGDFDLGQASGTANATGNGTGVVRDITTLMSTGGDLDIGQTSATGAGINSGTGNLSLERVAVLNVTSDMDVGQSTGDGRSTGNGVAVISDVGSMTIGDSLDVAKVRAFNTAINSGIGNLTLRNVTGTIGFTAVNPGSIEIARVLVSETARGTGNGTLTMDRSRLQVANDVIVGELALAGTNSQNSAQASLHLWDSSLDTRDLFVASRFNGTTGTVSGLLEVRRSLVSVGSMFSLNPTSTLQIDLDGTTRATGLGAANEYGAIDTDMAVLDGVMAIEANANYTGPAARGGSDVFQLISALVSMAGSFDSVTYEGTTIGTTAHLRWCDERRKRWTICQL